MPTATDAKHVTIRCQFCASWNRVDAARAADRPKCGKCQRPLLLDRPVPVDDETFSRTVEGSDIPVLVDFYADWCGPCKMMAPSVDALAHKYLGRVLVAKLDTDAAPNTASRFNIRGIPTVMVFRGGARLTERTGALPQRALEELVDGALG